MSTQHQDVKFKGGAVRRFYQIIMLMAMGVGLYYIYYRLRFTFNPFAIVFSILFFLAELHGFISLWMLFFEMWSPTNRKAPKPQGERTVDVFIPTYDERVNLVRQTAVAARDMDYEHRTYVLDDGGRDEIRRMCEQIGVDYITRAEHDHAKAGNLNYAMDRTDGQIIAVFDCDHVPQKNFLTSTLGYFNDEKVGIVQTPQCFYNFGNIQDAGTTGESGRHWDEVDLFYHVIQPGKDRWNASYFCGTNGLIRREALDQIEGFDYRTITEDMLTSVRIHSNGWQSVYHNEMLATGLAATDIGGYWRQHLRWAIGNLRVLNYCNPLTMRGLSLPQRICYFNSIFSWTGGLRQLVYYLTPLVMLLTAKFPIYNFTYGLLALYIAQLVISLSAFKIVSRGYGRIVRSEFFNMLNYHVLAGATVRAMLGLGTKKFWVTKKTGEGHEVPLRTIWPHVAYASLMYCGLLWTYLRATNGLINPAYAPLYSVAAVFGTLDAALAVWAIMFSLRHWEKRGEYRFHESVPVAVAAGANPGQNGKVVGFTTDLNDAGFTLQTFADLDVGQSYHMRLFPAEHHIDLTATLVHYYPRTGPDNLANTYGVKVEEIGSVDLTRLEEYLVDGVIPHMFQQMGRRSGRMRQALARRAHRRQSEKRDAPRANLRLPVRVGEPLEPDAYDLAADVSKDGMRVTLPREFAEGQTEGFALLTPTGEVSGQAEVEWRRPVQIGTMQEYEYGLRFTEMTPQSSRALANTLSMLRGE